MSVERWVFLKDGKLFMHEELDGEEFVRCGAQAQEWKATIEELKACYPKAYERFVREHKDVAGGSTY